VKNKHHNSQD